MSDWHCYTCKVAVEEADVEVQFLDYRFFCAGLVCPECQEKWLTEEVVVEEIRPPEVDAKARMA